MIIKTLVENFRLMGLVLYVPVCVCAAVDTTSFARPGLSDDEELQSALSYCSDHNKTCIIPSGKMYQITTDLFIWGGANLIGTSVTSELQFKPKDGARPLLQVGLAPKNLRRYATTPYIPKPVFTGRIENLTIKIDSEVTREVLVEFNKAQPDSPLERIFRPYKLIFLWRTDGAEITKNRIDVGHSKYGFTGSGNDANFVPAGTAKPGAWVGTANQLVRKNIRITHNHISSLDYKWTESGKNSDGNEGIALTLFDGAYIAHNTVTGFGDDIIAFHFGNNAIIEQNYGDSVDGRIYVSGSRCVGVLYNDIARKPTRLYKNSGPDEFPNGWGASLLTLDGETRSPPPTQTIIYGNKLFIPAGLREDAMNFVGVRAATISRNSLFQPAAAHQYGSVANADLSVQTGMRFTPLRYINLDLKHPSKCFAGTKLVLPNELTFLPIEGDHYERSAIHYMPVKNVLVEANNLAPSSDGTFTAAKIALHEHPTSAARAARPPAEELLGPSADGATCNTSIRLGKSRCHVMAIVRNRAAALPWHNCHQNQYSNLPGPGSSDSICAGKNAPQQGENNEVREGGERIFYQQNFTVSDGTLNNNDVAFSVPGIIPAEYFHAASTDTGVMQIQKKCRNPFRINLPAHPSKDAIGECDVEPPQGAWVLYHFEVLEAGSYQLIFRLAAKTLPAMLAYSIDEGASVSLTVNEYSYVDLSRANINLKQGFHRLKIYFKTPGLNLNYIRLKIVREGF